MSTSTIGDQPRNSSSERVQLAAHASGHDSDRDRRLNGDTHDDLVCPRCQSLCDSLAALGVGVEPGDHDLAKALVEAVTSNTRALIDMRAQLATLEAALAPIVERDDLFRSLRHAQKLAEERKEHIAILRDRNNDKDPIK